MGREHDQDDDRQIDGFVVFPSDEPAWKGFHDDPDDQVAGKLGRRGPMSLQQLQEEIGKNIRPSPFGQFQQRQEELRREKEKNRRLKVTVDRDKSEITLDGKTYPVEHTLALFVDTLAKARDWIPGPELRRQEKDLFDRPDRVRDKVSEEVPPLAGYFETTHRGYRLKPELLE